MQTPQIIESTRNETIKRARALAARKGRDEQGLHFIEGELLIREAAASGAALRDAFIEEGHTKTQTILENSGATVHIVTRAVMEALAQTSTPQQVCATVRTPSLAAPQSYGSGLIAVLDRVQDPGNMGTIIRTADAMGCAGVLLGEGCADPYAPKPLRAAMGSNYHLPIWQADLEEELKKLREEGFLLVCGHLRGAETLPEPTGKCAIVIGNEARGVSDPISALCTLCRLPLYGRAESLNASVAAGILIYEMAKRMHG